MLLDHRFDDVAADIFHAYLFEELPHPVHVAAGRIEKPLNAELVEQARQFFAQIDRPVESRRRTASTLLIVPTVRLVNPSERVVHLTTHIDNRFFFFEPMG